MRNTWVYPLTFHSKPAQSFPFNQNSESSCKVFAYTYPINWLCRHLDAHDRCRFNRWRQL